MKPGYLWLLWVLFVREATGWGVSYRPRAFRRTTTTTALADTRREFLEKAAILATGGATSGNISPPQTDPTLTGTTPLPRRNATRTGARTTGRRRYSSGRSPSSSPSRRLQSVPKQTSSSSGNLRRLPNIEEEEEIPDTAKKTSKSKKSQTSIRTKQSGGTTMETEAPSTSQRASESATKVTTGSRKTSTPRRTSSGSRRSMSNGSGGSRRSSSRRSSRSSSSRGGSSPCFPADALVEIQTHGHITIRRIEDVATGDYVRSGGNTFSKVYAFGMRTNDELVDFIRLTTDSGHVLEASDNHIIFVDNEAVLVIDVRIGDLLALPQNGGTRTKVVDIDKISKKGAYHPYTLDGNLVVNGIQVSVHSIDSVVPHVSIFGVQLLDIHDFQQLLFAPLRLLCSMSQSDFCSEQNHDTVDGSHHWVNVVENLQIFLLPGATDDEETNILRVSSFWPINTSILAFLLFCSLVEWLMNILLWVLMFVLLVASYWYCSLQVAISIPCREKCHMLTLNSHQTQAPLKGIE